MNKNICGLNAVCINQYGSYSCECLKGYMPQYSSIFECEDFDECSTECTNDCDKELGNCINTMGSFSCSCIEVYTGTGHEKQCFDIYECLILKNQTQILNNCDQNADCFNLIGSYYCKCKHGFYGNGVFCEGKLELNSINQKGKYLFLIFRHKRMR